MIHHLAIQLQNHLLNLSNIIYKFINDNCYKLYYTYLYYFFISSQYLAIFCSFLLGFGDSCFNTQIYNVIGQRYSENSAPAMALFKFMQVYIL